MNRGFRADSVRNGLRGGSKRNDVEKKRNREMKTSWRKTLVLAAAGIGLAAAGGCATAYRVNGVAHGDGNADFAENVASDVRSELLGSGYKVLGPDATAGWFQRQVDIDLKVSKKQSAKLDKWCSYDGKVKASVEKKGELLGEKTFTAQSGRVRSEEAAEEEMRDTFADQIGDWLKKILNKAR